MGANNFKFFDRFFAPPPKIVHPFRPQRALNLRRPAQKSLKSHVGIGPKSALASPDFGTFPAQETARICAAGRKLTIVKSVAIQIHIILN